MILDTSFIIDVTRGKFNAIEKSRELEERNVSEIISSATIFELYTGIERAEKPADEKQKIKEVLKSKQVLPSDNRIMRRAGRIHGKQINKGRRIGNFDCIIAATALHEEQRVLTRNKKDFKKIDSLEVESY